MEKTYIRYVNNGFVIPWPSHHLQERAAYTHAAMTPFPGEKHRRFTGKFGQAMLED